jgi:hypothetical protein
MIEHGLVLREIIFDAGSNLQALKGRTVLALVGTLAADKERLRHALRAFKEANKARVLDESRWETSGRVQQPGRRLAGQTLDGLRCTVGAMPSEKFQLLVLQRIRRPKELFEIVARTGGEIADILEIRFER